MGGTITGILVLVIAGLILYGLSKGDDHSIKY